jgi:hypothetical protein
MLIAGDMQEIDDIFAGIEIHGDRYGAPSAARVARYGED